MPLPHETSSTLVIAPLSTLSPPSNSRTWQSAPHPTLPIIATACSDRTVRVYSLTSFTLLHTVAGGHKRSIRSVSWKPGVRGQTVLATGSFDGNAGIWRRKEEGLEEDYTSRRVVEEDDEEEEDEDEYQFSCILDGHESEIKSLTWSPSGQYLATCSRDKSVWIWEELDDDNFETVAVLQEHEGDVKCVAWHPEEDLLASASYDDTVRLYKEDADDWVQVAMLDAHKKTVWWVEFEGSGMTKLFRNNGTELTAEQSRYLEWRDRSGPRLVTSSDDCTVRIWHRKPREHSTHVASTSSIPSILRSSTVDEEWIQEAILPQRHERAVYSVSWSSRSGLLVSSGSDGKIIVYQERWQSQAPNGIQIDGVDPASESTGDDEELTLTEWVVAAELFSAHDVFEVNHVCWARRSDKGKRAEDEEVIVSTGDDGEVKVWTLEEEAVQV